MKRNQLLRSELAEHVIEKGLTLPKLATLGKSFSIVASIVWFALLMMTSSVFAASADRFIVRIARNPVAVNEAVDITVQAVDVRGEIIEDYDGDIFMEVENTRERDVTLPADGVYTFQAVDQWSKIFNKWLVFKKEGTYKFRVYEVLDPSNEGTVEVVVKGEGASDGKQSITIASPTSGSIEQNSTINVIGTSKFPNSPIEFYVDNKKVQDTITESDGSFSTYLSKISVGSHSLTIKIVDIDGNTLGESEVVPFSYKTADLNLYKSIVTTPANPEAGQTITATVTALDTVSSVEMIIDGQTYVMDKLDAGVYTKSFKLSDIGEYPIDLNITAGESTRSYQKVKSITTTASTAAITSIKYSRDPKKLEQVSLQWSIKWEFASYRVMYGTDNKSLSQNITATTTNAQVTLDPSKTYYLQVQWLDASGQLKGKASQIITIPAADNSDPIHPSAGTCNVAGIVISAIQSGGNYYITWPSIAGVDKYTIYKSDKPNTPVAQATKVAETVENTFLYPFDPKAPTETYSYYTVQATCNDGTVVTVDETKKIQVWPVQNIALVLLAAMLIYGSYRFTRLD
jgi:hypothetical protein